MSTLREAAQQALEAPGCERLREWVSIGPVQRAAVESFLQAALAQEGQEHNWLTKELMADYLDMVAEAIENDSSETLRHKAHWMRRDGEI